MTSIIVHPGIMSSAGLGASLQGCTLMGNLSPQGSSAYTASALSMSNPLLPEQGQFIAPSFLRFRSSRKAVQSHAQKTKLTPEQIQEKVRRLSQTPKAFDTIVESIADPELQNLITSAKALMKQGMSEEHDGDMRRAAELFVQAGEASKAALAQSTRSGALDDAERAIIFRGSPLGTFRLLRHSNGIEHTELFEKAIDLYNRIWESDPHENAWALLEIGLCRIAMGFHDSFDILNGHHYDRRFQQYCERVKATPESVHTREAAIARLMRKAEDFAVEGNLIMAAECHYNTALLEMHDKKKLRHFLAAAQLFEGVHQWKEYQKAAHAYRAAADLETDDEKRSAHLVRSEFCVWKYSTMLELAGGFNPSKLETMLARLRKDNDRENMRAQTVRFLLSVGALGPHVSHSGHVEQGHAYLAASQLESANELKVQHALSAAQIFLAHDNFAETAAAYEAASLSEHEADKRTEYRLLAAELYLGQARTAIERPESFTNADRTAVRFYQKAIAMRDGKTAKKALASYGAMMLAQKGERKALERRFDTAVSAYEAAAYLAAMVPSEKMRNLKETANAISDAFHLFDADGPFASKATELVFERRDDIAEIERLHRGLTASAAFCRENGITEDAFAEELFALLKEGKNEDAIKSYFKNKLLLQKHRIQPTPLLIDRLTSTPNKQATVAEWKALMRSFARGHFDASNDLHRHLEYTNFRAIVDHEKVRKHVKNHFTLEQYLAIFEKPSNPALEPLSDTMQFELECLAYEAGLLEFFASRVQRHAHEIGCATYLVPNLSYGFAPTSGLIPRLMEHGIHVIVGPKVGSTESHENKDVMDSRLFKGHRSKIMRKQPVMLVVDGTKHLVARDGSGKGARFPDAYQGYLNQMIAMNDAMGFQSIDYSYVGKSKEDIERLRETEEFQRAFAVYEEILEKETPEGLRPYRYGLWNTAGMDLIIRGDREKLAAVKPFDPEDISGPMFIFCNVGVLHDQLPEELRERHPGQTHTPAYLDDSGKIIEFEFGYDTSGVRYLNRLEREMRRLMDVEDADEVSEFIRRLKLARYRSQARPEEAHWAI